MKDKIYKNKDWLQQKYIGEKLSIYKIAKSLNYHPQTIWHHLKKFNIQRRLASEGNIGRKNSLITIEKMSQSAIQRSKNPEYREKQRLSHLGNKHTEEEKRKMRAWKRKTGIDNPLYGKPRSEEIKKKISSTLKKRYQNKEFKERAIKALLRGLLVRPTSYERQIIEVCKKYNLPFKYVGNGEFILAGKNPDFVHTNGKKLLIEVFHNYWKPEDYIKNRAILFKQFGFKTLFLDDSDMEDKNWERICLKKISSFGGKNVRTSA